MADWFEDNAPKADEDWFAQNAPPAAVAEPPTPPTTPIIPRSGMQTESLEAREFMRTSPDQIRGTGDQPIIPIPKIPQQEGALAQAGAGLVNVATGLVESVETPQMIASLPIFPARLTQAIFGAQALKGAYEEGKAAFAPDKTIQERVESGGRGLTDLIFGGALLHGATRGLIAKPEIPETPVATEQAAKEVISSATQERQIAEGRQPEYTGNVESRPPKEAGNRGIVEPAAPEQPKEPVAGDLWYQGVSKEGATQWVTHDINIAKGYAARRGEGAKVNVYTPDQVGETAFADPEGNPISPQEYAKHNWSTTIQTGGKPLPNPVETLDAAGKPIVETAPPETSQLKPLESEVAASEPKQQPTVHLPDYENGGFKELPAVYLRFGDLPEGKSGKYLEGKKVGEEPGVSIVKAWKDPKTGKYVVRTTGTEDVEGIEGIANRKIYELSGKEMTELGSDEEPLLHVGSANVIKEVHPSEITTSDLHNIALDGTEWDERQTPNVPAAETPPSPVAVPEVSPEYQAALDKSRTATQEFSKVQEQYRNREVGDSEYLDARLKHDAAQAEFDKAFIAERDRPKTVAPEAAKPATGELFPSAEVPFNLRGEEPPPGIGPEGAARAKAESQYAAEKAQTDMFEPSKEEQARLQAEHEQELTGAFQEHIARGGDELLDAVKSGGGIPALSHPQVQQFKGELNNIREAYKAPRKERIKYADIFKKDAPNIDALTQELKAKGFNVDTPADTLALIEDRVRTGKPVYGSEAKGQALEEQSLGGYAMGAAGTREIPMRGWRDMIDSGEPRVDAPEARTFEAGRVGKILDTVGEGLRNIHDFITVNPIPKLNRVGLSDAAYQHASARNSVVHTVRHLLSRVFPYEYKNPELMQKTGDILTKDNILGVYDQAKERAAASEPGSPENKAASKAIEKIEQAHDLAAYDRDVQAAKTDPKIVGNIERWKQWVNPEMDRMYNEIKGYDPATLQEPRGRHFEARINLLPKDQAAQIAQFTDMEKPMPEITTSNYRNPNVKRDPFMRKATGTGQYSTDPGLMLTNTIGRRWNEVTKLRMYKTIEDTGNGIMTEPGERPEIDSIGGEKLVRMPIRVPETNENGITRTVEKSMWLKQSIARETRDVLNTDLAAPSNPVFRALTNIQLLQAVDMTAHLKNIHTVISNSLGASKGWQDAIRKMPFLASADAVGRIASVTREVLSDTPQIRAEIAEMAKQGMIRPSYPATGIQKITHGQQAIHAVDTASRVVMNRFWDNLVERGMAPDSMQARRAFVQQIGEYNRRLLGHFTRNLRDYGASPFIVAGRTFNQFSKRLLLGSPGFKALTPQAAAAARAYQISGLAALVTLPAIINHFTTGRFGGRPGVPIGAIDTGTNNAKGEKRVIDVMQLSGVRRGLRATGAGAVIEGVREGKSVNEIGGKMIEDVTGAASHPWLGPGLSALYSGISGKRLDLRGGAWPYLAKQKKEGGLAQYGENLRVTLKNQNPLIYGLVAPLVGETDDTYKEGLSRGFLKAPLSAVGYQEKPGESAFSFKKESKTKETVSP